jgi:hypothetical protein
MRIISTLTDSRIASTNLMTEVSVGDYLGLVEGSLNNNEYQRRRVRSSNTVYSLMKRDFLDGCVLPPIVLALREGTNTIQQSDQLILQELQARTSQLVILDGLQRTYSLLDLRNEITDQVKRAAFLNQILRVEIYIGINRLGILYRMLTLNTGQSPMSLRQQIEMLYLDLADSVIEGVQLIREVDDTTINQPNQYSFRSMIDGYNSYIERNELPIDRFEILETIKGLNNLSSETRTANLFNGFVSTYHSFVTRLDQLVGPMVFINTRENQEDLLHLAENTLFLSDSGQPFEGKPFGDTVVSMFSKSQALTGFGAALGKLKDHGVFNDFSEVKQLIAINLTADDAPQAVASLLRRLEAIRLTSTKIGNAQRLYFQFFFRELFNQNSDSFCKIETAVAEAYKKYQSQVM